MPPASENVDVDADVDDKPRRWTLSAFTLALGGMVATLLHGCGGGASGYVPIVHSERPIGSCKQVGRFVGHAEASAGSGATAEQLLARARDDMAQHGGEGGATHIEEVVVRTTPPDAPTEVEVEGLGYLCTGSVKYAGGSMLGATDARATMPEAREPGPAPAPPPKPTRGPPPPMSERARVPQ